MRTLQGFIDRIQAILDDPELPGNDHSMYVRSARQQLVEAINNLVLAPTDLSVAIERLKVEYERRQEERFDLGGGRSVSLGEVTAGKLNALMGMAELNVAAGNPTAPFWIDDGPVRIDVTSEELLDQKIPYAMRYGAILTWVSLKRQEIEAAEDPLSVPLD